MGENIMDTNSKRDSADPAEFMVQEKAEAEAALGALLQRQRGLERALSAALTDGGPEVYAALTAELAALPPFIAAAQAKVAAVQAQRTAEIQRHFHEQHEARFAELPAREFIHDNVGRVTGTIIRAKI